MAIAIDASTPIRWTGVVDITNGGTVTSAAFTAPANALLVMCACYDTSSAWAPGSRTASDTGGLTWTPVRVERLGSETTVGGASGIWTARTTTAVSRTASFALGVVGGGDYSTGRVSVKLYVLTGVDVDGTPVDSVTASNEGGSTTNSINTTSITPGANGLLVVCDCDWAAGNGADFDASSDLTQDTAFYSSAISVLSGYKTCTSGVGVTGNLNGGGGSAVQHKWCQITVRELAAGSPIFDGGIFGGKVLRAPQCI